VRRRRDDQVIALRAILVALALVASMAYRHEAKACAPAPPQGEAVRIADEEAIIHWDAASKREHFIRRASFRSSARSFGFLVPTPSQPELGEVKDHVFQMLASKLVPKVVRRIEGYDWAGSLACNSYLGARSHEGMAPAGAGVEVLEQRRVAGYDAAVLRADDAAALSRWLGDHGYSQGASLAAWLAVYVKERWIITAFKVADDAEGSQGTRAFGTAAVRMSFDTDRPFYPYREPADQREVLEAKHREVAVGARSLRIFFVADRKYEGRLGDGAPFAAETKLATWATPGWCPGGEPACGSTDSDTAFLPARFFLSVFHDTSNPRPGSHDLFFEPAGDAAVVEVPPVIVVEAARLPFPPDIAAFVLVFAVVFVWAARRARRARPTSQ
jgi:hypothetical protein